MSQEKDSRAGDPEVDITEASWKVLLEMKFAGAIPSDYGLIHLLLPRITKEIGSIRKGRTPSSGPKFNFRGIDDALNAISPILSAHGCHCSVDISEPHLDRHEKLKKSNGEEYFTYEYHAQLTMRVLFYGPDGSFVENVTRGEGADNTGSDKATNKAMSGAMKYALFFGLLVPVHADEIDEPDAEGNESELFRSAKKLIKAARGMPSLQKLRGRVDSSSAFDETEKTELLLLMDDKEEQINS